MPSEEEFMEALLKSGLSKAEIDKMVKETISRMKGLINEKTALFVIMKQQGLASDEDKKQSTSEKDVTINNLSESDKNVNIVGRINDFTEVRTFNRKDGSKGFFSWFWLKDPTGEIKIVLWDDRAKYVGQDDFKINELVRILNGQAKLNRDGILEIHVGNKGDIEMNPSDIDLTKFPKIKTAKDSIDISNITIQMRRVMVEGKILIKGDLREFNRKNSDSPGFVQRVTIRDDSGSIPVVFWNEDTKKISEFNEGDIISLSNLSVKTQYNNKELLELHFQNNSTITLVKENTHPEGSQTTISIEKALSEEGTVNIEGEVVEIDNLKEIEFKSGDKGKLLSLGLSDSTAAIRITFWREKAEEYSDLKIGDKIRIKGILIKFNNFSNSNEGTIRSNSVIERNISLQLKETHNLPAITRTGTTPNATFSGEYTSISNINSDGFYEIKGFIAKKINRITVYEACKVCRKKASNCTCPNGPQDTEYRIILNLIIDDGTDSIRASFIGKTAEELLGLEPIDVKLQIDKDDSSEFLNDISMQLLGKDLAIKGRSKYSDYTNSYEIVASNFKPIDPETEAERILKEIEQ